MKRLIFPIPLLALILTSLLALASGCGEDGEKGSIGEEIVGTSTGFKANTIDVIPAVTLEFTVDWPSEFKEQNPKRFLYKNEAGSPQEGTSAYDYVGRGCVVRNIPNDSFNGYSVTAYDNITQPNWSAVVFARGSPTPGGYGTGQAGAGLFFKGAGFLKDNNIDDPVSFKRSSFFENATVDHRCEVTLYADLKGGDFACQVATQYENRQSYNYKVTGQWKCEGEFEKRETLLSPAHQFNPWSQRSR